MLSPEPRQPHVGHPSAPHVGLAAVQAGKLVVGRVSVDLNGRHNSHS